MIPIHEVEAVCLNFTQTRCGVLNMNQTYTAIVKQDGPWWIGWIEEVPGVNGQESTRDELLQSLRVTLLEAIEHSPAHSPTWAVGQEEVNIRPRIPLPGP